jgi:serine/alanine adding enzyme
MTDLHIVDYANLDGWDQYVERHPKGSIFHTSSMARVFESTRNYRPLAIAACDGGGKIVALLMAVRVQTLFGAASRIASRSIWHAEPICDDSEQGRQGLLALIQHHDRHMQANTLFCEVRPMYAAGSERKVLEECGHEYADYLNYICDVSRPVDELWSRISKNCRKAIRREERRLTLREDKSLEGMQLLYRHLQLSYARSMVPLADFSLFEAALRLLPQDWFRLVIAYHNGQPVASALDLVYKGLLFAWYGGVERIPGVAAHDLVTWDSMKWAAEHHCSLYDFGGAGVPDQSYGPRDFKSKFGGELVSFGRYRKVYAPRKLWLAQAVYQRARRWISPNVSQRV